MSNDFQDQTRRINALIAKAEGASTEEEAQAFFGKASELMTKYAIDQASLDEARAPEDVKADIDMVTLQYSGVKDRWRALGVQGSALVVDTSPTVGIAISDYGQTVYLYGRRGDVEHMSTLLSALWRQAESYYRRWRKESPEYALAYRIGKEFGDWQGYYSAMNGYVLGFALGVADQMKLSSRNAAQGNELVLRGTKELVTEKMQDDGVKQSRRRAVRTSQEASRAGYRDGSRASMAAELR